MWLVGERRRGGGSQDGAGVKGGGGGGAEDTSMEAWRYECDKIKMQEVMKGGQRVSCASLCVCVTFLLQYLNNQRGQQVSGQVAELKQQPQQQSNTPLNSPTTHKETHCTRQVSATPPPPPEGRS